jgi:hypothetical protein
MKTIMTIEDTGKRVTTTWKQGRRKRVFVVAPDEAWFLRGAVKAIFKLKR